MACAGEVLRNARTVVVVAVVPTTVVFNDPVNREFMTQLARFSVSAVLS